MTTFLQAYAGQTVVLNPLGNDDVPDGGPVITQVDGQNIPSGQTIVSGRVLARSPSMWTAR